MVQGVLVGPVVRRWDPLLVVLAQLAHLLTSALTSALTLDSLDKVPYAQIAAFAHRAGRRSLALMILGKEPIKLNQVCCHCCHKWERGAKL